MPIKESIINSMEIVLGPMSSAADRIIVESLCERYGINNALLEVGINVKVTSKINLPFISKDVEVSTTVPIVMKIIQGKIPNMYLDNIKASSNIIEKSIE